MIEVTAGPVTTIRMAHPERRNALGPAMLDALIAAFADLTPDVRCVVLRAGPADKVWCAGFDVAEMADASDPLAPGTRLPALFAALRACAAPVIGMLHGSAWGGGCDLALRCDLLIGDPTASLAFTPAKLGLPYDGDGLRRALLRCGPALATEMFATAEPVLADRAHAAGLLNHLVPEAELEAFTIAMADRIARLAPLSVAAAKAQLLAIEAALPLPDPALRGPALGSADFREGLAAFAGRRAPVFQGR